MAPTTPEQPKRAPDEPQPATHQLPLPPGPEAIYCQVYRQHQAFHRLIAGAWICTVCGPRRNDP